MSVKTEFEIRFIFDATKPITGEEREYLLGAIQTWGRFRSRTHTNANEDVKQLTEKVMEMPAETTDVVSSAMAMISPQEPRTYRQRQLDQERALILRALNETSTVAAAARQMGMSYRTFWRKMKMLGLTTERAK